MGCTYCRCYIIYANLILTLTACSTRQLVESTPTPERTLITPTISLTSSLPTIAVSPNQWSTIIPSQATTPPAVSISPDHLSTITPPLLATQKSIITTDPEGINEPTPIIIREPVNITDASFETVVLESSLPVLVVFWAPWCGPCRMLEPTLDKVAYEYTGRMLVTKINTDENPEWAMKYGVLGIPTMLFVADGKIIHKQMGALPETMLLDLVIQFHETLKDDQN